MLSGRTEVAKPHPSCLPSSPRGHPRLNSGGSGYVPSGTFGKDDELRRAEKNARSSNLPVPSASVIPSPPERTASEEIAAVKRQVYRSSAQCGRLDAPALCTPCYGYVLHQRVRVG